MYHKPDNIYIYYIMCIYIIIYIYIYICKSVSNLANKLGHHLVFGCWNLECLLGTATIDSVAVMTASWVRVHGSSPGNFHIATGDHLIRGFSDEHNGDVQ